MQVSQEVASNIVSAQEIEHVQLTCSWLIANINTPNLQPYRDLAEKLRKKYSKKNK